MRTRPTREGRAVDLARQGGCRPAAPPVWPGRELQRRDFAAGGGGLRAPCKASPEALDPLGQRLRTPAERRVDGRFVSATRLVAGHGAFVEIRAQARHSVGEAPMSTQMSARCFAQFSCSSRLFIRPTVRRAGALARMPKRQRRQAGAPVDTRGSRSECDRRHSVSSRGRVKGGAEVGIAFGGAPWICPPS
jgi:hypothetical protein